MSTDREPTAADILHDFSVPQDADLVSSSTTNAEADDDSGDDDDPVGESDD